ncbi:uncharacterized protein KGF55_001472 [Candida pseudojiufengensis]|uniref:uncharacterized protein n=1 Tax=Candida pseudojiufengensis TaxID=497109 RepID=UPI00222415A4|nr:uncharacterized protein KGF55_001472 [Candida pseudojiufengensis]KAI5965252.1 hypothetical protein KGF55_001472 [Candida pseudojiufengensis]
MSLFLKESLNEVQTKFLDKIIPDLHEDSINLNSFEKFDDLLQFLEISSSVSPSTSSISIQSDSCFANNKNLIYPSVEILHLLLTLCSRSNNLNWTQNSSLSKNGIVESLGHIKLINSLYSEFLHKNQLNQRCFIILNNYLKIIDINNDKILYDLLLTTMNGLIERKKQNQSPTRQSQLPFQQQSITSMLQSETNSRRTSPRRSTPPMKRQKVKSENEEENDDDEDKDSTYIVISNSEDDSDIDEKVPIKKETQVKKDPDSKNKKGSSASPSPSKNSKNSKNSSISIFAKSDSKTETWEGIRIFDESLLKEKLTAHSNDFNIWKLVNWTFYCSGLSTIYYPLQKQSECHLIYQSQSNALEIIFGYFEINLVEQLNKIFDSANNDPILELYQNSNSPYTKLASLKVEDNSSILLSNSVKTLGFLQSQWYDRIVEFVFNGLSSKLVFPKTCYEHETIMIEKENKYKKNQSIAHNDLKNEWDQSSDNMTSMNLRFKICSIVFYWSLVFEPSLSSSQRNRKSTMSLNSAVFLRFLREKIKYIDYRYLIEFYHSSQIPSKINSEYKKLFLVNVSIETLKEMIGNRMIEDDEFQNFKLYHHLNNQDTGKNKNYQIQNLETVTNWINNSILYTQLTENVTWKSFNEFYQSWMKLNFALEWLLSWILDDLYNEDLDIYKDTMIYQKFKKADTLKKEIFLEFIKVCILPKAESGLEFQLNDDDVESMKGKISKSEHFSSILELYL